MKADCLLSKGSKLCNSGLTARYQYDPWGRRTKVAGTGVEGDFGFTGHYFHAPSGLHLALYRAYNAETGRWLSRDPLFERSPSNRGGTNVLRMFDDSNLYFYSLNRPIDRSDPDGRDPGAIVIVVAVAVTLLACEKTYYTELSKTVGCGQCADAKSCVAAGLSIFLGYDVFMHVCGKSDGSTSIDYVYYPGNNTT